MADRGRPRAQVSYEQIKKAILNDKLTIAQAAEKFGVSDDTIRRRLKEGAELAQKKGASKKAQEKEPKAPKPTQHALAVLAERSKNYDSCATAADCIADLRAVQERHKDKFITRNFYRINGKYSDMTWNRFFGTFEEFRSQAKLQLSRTQRLMEKAIARHAALDEARRFYRLEVEPWIGKYAKYEKYQPDGSMKKMIFAGDFHDVDTDLFCLEVFIDTCKVEQPDIIVLLGDVYDLYEFSRFDIDPRKTNLTGRMAFVRERIFARLRNACPNAQIDFIIGNHEFRLLRHMASKTPFMANLMELMNASLPVLFGLDRYQINLVSKGNTSAFFVKEIKDEMKKNWKKYFDCIVANHAGYENFGMTTISAHTHKPKMETISDVDRGPVNKVTIGPMCKLDADYTDSKTDWQNSFAIAYVDPVARRAQVNQVLFHETFVNVNGRYYFRNMESAEIRSSEEILSAIREQEIQGFVHRDLMAALVAGDAAVAAGAI